MSNEINWTHAAARTATETYIETIWPNTGTILCYKKQRNFGQIVPRNLVTWAVVG